MKFLAYLFFFSLGIVVGVSGMLGHAWGKAMSAYEVNYDGLMDCITIVDMLRPCISPEKRKSFDAIAALVDSAASGQTGFDGASKLRSDLELLRIDEARVDQKNAPDTDHSNQRESKNPHY